MQLTSLQSWVFQAGTLLHWINAIIVVLACYRDATCMEGLCTGGKENIHLASKPQGCPQKNNLFITPCLGVLSVVISSCTVCVSAVA